MGSSWCPPASWCKRFNVNNAWLKSERFLTGWVSFPDLLRSSNFACSGSILLLTHDRCDLVLQEHPMHDKLLHLDCVGSFVHGKTWSRKNRSWIPLKSLFLHLFFKLWAWWYSLFSGSFRYLWPWRLPFLITYSGSEKKVHRIYNEKSIGHCFF